MKILFANDHGHETPGILRFIFRLLRTIRFRRLHFRTKKLASKSLLTSAPAIFTLFAGYANLLLIGTLVQRAAVSQYFSPKVHEEILALMHELDLEFVGVERRL